MIFLYQIALLLMSPALAAWLIFRALSGRMPGLGQRLGRFPAGAPASDQLRVWLHAVSLGEMKIAAALAAELRRQVPALCVIFTTSTRTGREEALRAAGAGDLVFYPPVDLAWVCRRFLRYLDPAILVVVETELWPNLFVQASRRGTPIVIANGRLSDRSWPRYRATGALWRRVLPLVERIHAASPADASRFRQLGAIPERVQLSGNLKFDVRRGQPGHDEFVPRAAARLAQSPQTNVLVAGSTMPGEEAAVLSAYELLQRQFPGLWLILAPRHPERFAEVGRLLAGGSLPFQRRTEWRPDSPDAVRGVLLLDTIGELSSVYQLATVAFVGGTVVPTGGHNILEPAIFGKPIVIGPSMENFQQIASLFLQHCRAVALNGTLEARVGALVQVPAAAALGAAIGYLLANPLEAARIGAMARAITEAHQGGYAKVCTDIASLLPPGRVRG